MGWRKHGPSLVWAKQAEQRHLSHPHAAHLAEKQAEQHRSTAEVKFHCLLCPRCPGSHGSSGCVVDVGLAAVVVRVSADVLAVRASDSESLLVSLGLRGYMRQCPLVYASSLTMKFTTVRHWHHAIRSVHLWHCWQRSVPSGFGG